jgi:hypothetical protein
LSRDDSLILAKLWQYISLSNGNGLRTYLGYLVTDSDVKAPQFAPLHLFGEIAYSLISSVYLISGLVKEGILWVINILFQNIG